MTSATEELRRLLDERGIGWSSPELKPRQTRLPNVKFEPWGEGTLKVTMFNLTPEQAIAATLEGGTCEIVLGEDDYGCDAMVCSKCFKKIDDACSPNYCPNCGAKVVKR